MAQLVTITSQGQISIPAKIRRKLGFDKSKRALVVAKGDRLEIRPVKDFMEMAGSFKRKAIKDKTIEEIMRLEKKAMAEAVAENYRRELTQVGENS